MNTNFSITTVFLTHEVLLYTDAGDIKIHLPTVRDNLTKNYLNSFYNFCNRSFVKKLQLIFKDMDSFTLVTNFITNPELTNVKELKEMCADLKKSVEFILPDFTIKERKIYVNNIEITQSIWDWLSYIVLKSCGSNVPEPQNFDGDEVGRKFYEAKMAAEEKIALIKSQGTSKSKSEGGIIDIFHLILYRFPSYTVDQLFDMTMYQVMYLQRLTSSILNYETGIMAYTAGNLKKAPQFFLK